MSVHLDQIVPLGRSLREYRLMFNLSEEDWAGKILDCGAGPASFMAEAIALGHAVVAVDPLYEFSADQIEQRFWATIDGVIAQVNATPDNWVWTVHPDSQALRRQRIRVMSRFLQDYPSDRYLAAALPTLPFADAAYDLALCSHLLFLYSDLLSLEFHLKAMQELCRVAPEVRIFPLLTLAAQPSSYVRPVRHALHQLGMKTEIVQVGYELQRGGNQMLWVRQI